MGQGLGQALEKRGGLKKSVPSKTAETVLGLLIPPACREQVLGGLHERYASPLQYFGDALSVVPCVIVSRIRRTTDPQVLLMEAFALYLSFVGVAWISGQSAFLYEPWGLLRLAIPTAVVLVALILADAYADPAKRSLVKPMVQTAFCIGLAFLSQVTFWATNPGLGVPARIMLYGAGISLVLVSALRVFFPKDDNRPRGAT
jgi:hypothetical protein